MVHHRLVDLARTASALPAELARIFRITAKALGEGDWRPSLNWLEVIEL